ncbi:MAG: hypothetical protein RLZZ222_11 [Actinomycetota bacterium]|jgi:hypothetical protein
MCAKTLCPFVSSTRNIALGNASATVPSISIAPSLLAKDQYLLLCYRVNEQGRTPINPGGCFGARRVILGESPLIREILAGMRDLAPPAWQKCARDEDR